MAKRKTYSKEFKYDSYLYLKAINRGDTCLIDGKEIKTTRELKEALGITWDSLYRWRDQFKAKEEFLGKHGKTLEEMKILDSDKEDENYDFKGDIKELEDFMSGFEPKHDEIFGIRFWGWFAKVKGIKGYSSMPLPQLKLRCGLILIEESGLVK